LEEIAMATTYQIRRASLTRQPTAVMRDELPVARLGPWLATCYRTVSAYLQDQGMVAVGPPFARFTFLGETAAVEAGFPVDREIDGNGQVEPSALPGGPVAMTTHLGRYEDLEEAYNSIREWIDDRGYAAAGPHWEVYFSDPAAESDPTHWRTDVVAPYRAA
jgi:effector-binding domain-containing protein